jgi:catechol 2,3-dioxygenase-like lactoylglutathione lyase family enzyme
MTRAMAGSLCVAAAAAIVAVLFGFDNDTDVSVLLSAITFAVCVPVAGAGLGRGALGAATIACTLGAFVLTLVAIWAQEVSDGLGMANGIVAILAVTGAHVCLVTDRPGAPRWAVHLALLGGVGAAALSIVAIAGAFGDEGDFAQGLAVLVVFAVLGTALTWILDRGSLSAVTALDHVQVAAPPGGEGAARAFYGALLGLRELESPAAPADRGGVWFEHVHVGIDEGFAPARKAHPALRVASDAALESVAARLAAAGCEVVWDGAVPGIRRFHVDDPFGNRVEVLAAPRALRR